MRYLLICLLLLASTAFASSFTALTVTPFGDQHFDITTGVTTLGSGGEIIDRETDLVLLGTYISYKEGSHVEAQGASVAGSFGRMSAAQVRYDVATQSLRASGGVVLRSPSGIALDTFELTIDLNSDIVVAKTNVSLKDPSIQAAGMVLFTSSAEIGFIGPFVYQQGSSTLQGSSSSDMLRLSWTIAGETVVFSTPLEADTEFKNRTLSYFQ